MQHGLDGFIIQIIYEILENKEIEINLDDLSWILSNLIRFIITDEIQIKGIFEILFRTLVEDINFMFFL